METHGLSDAVIATAGVVSAKKLVDVSVRCHTATSEQSLVKVGIDGVLYDRLEKEEVTAKELREYVSRVYPGFKKDVHKAQLLITVEGANGLAKGAIIEDDDTHPKIGTFEYVIEEVKITPAVVSSASAACTLEEVNEKITNMRNLIKEFMKVSSDEAFKDIKQQLRDQISLNYDSELVSEIEKKTPEMQHNVKSMIPTEGGLDFAFLYSNPLVMKDGNSVKALGEPVNFSSECNDIMKVLEEKRKQFKVHIECASQDQFFQVLRRKPKVLHIMCHGTEIKGAETAGTPATENDYFLEFEGDNGTQFEMHLSDLEKRLESMGENPLEGIDVCYLNACHSGVNSINQENRWFIVKVRCQRCDHIECCSHHQRCSSD